jgi:hypothetical protein
MASGACGGTGTRGEFDRNRLDHASTQRYCCARHSPGPPGRRRGRYSSLRGKGHNLLGKEKAKPRHVRGFVVERGLISLPSLSRWRHRGGMTDDYAVVVTFVTDWA